MKKGFFLFLVIVSIFACKKKEVLIANQNVLFGNRLDASIQLPNQDTTNAFSFFQGEINGQKFCAVTDKDSFKLADFASYNYGKYEIRSDTFGAAFSWNLQQYAFNDFKPNSWALKFYAPGYAATYSKTSNASLYSSFIKETTTPNTIFKVGGIYGPGYDSIINYHDEAINKVIAQGKVCTIDFTYFPSAGSAGVTASTFFTPQSSTSYCKLVSVRYFPYYGVYPYTNYHYELTYEFECDLGSDSYPVKLTKGRAKFWVVDFVK